VQFTVTAQNDTADTLTTMNVSVVFYDSTSQEVTSNPAVPFMETVPPGQSVSAQESSDGAAGIASCSVAGYS
jgi:hypothetical protein